MTKRRWITALAISSIGLAACAPPPTGGGYAGPAAGCYESTADRGDIYYNGTPNEIDNTDRYASNDGTCTDSHNAPITLLEAPDYDAAIEICTDLFGGLGSVAPDRYDDPYWGFTGLPLWRCTG